MKRIFIYFLCAALMLLIPGTTATGTGSQLTLSPPLLPAQSLRTGVFVVENPVYTGQSGRATGLAAAFHSADTADAFFVLPAVAGNRIVQVASIYLFPISGSYSGMALLTLEIYDMLGVLQRTVSAAAIDLQSVDTGQWLNLSLSTALENQMVHSGEFLAFHFHLNGAPGGSLQAGVLFDVTTAPYTQFMPLNTRG